MTDRVPAWAGGPAVRSDVGRPRPIPSYRIGDAGIDPPAEALA